MMRAPPLSVGAPVEGAYLDRSALGVPPPSSPAPVFRTAFKIPQVQSGRRFAAIVNTSTNALATISTMMSVRFISFRPETRPPLMERSSSGRELHLL
jgi:hypothetical protein